MSARIIIRAMPSPKGFDSAYPGSMSEREDGYYLCRNDHVSLAAGLIELIASRDREIADLRALVEELRAGLVELEAMSQGSAA